jgi:hypothetical protein
MTGAVVPLGLNPRYSALSSRLRVQAYKSDRTTTGSPISGNWQEVGAGMGQYVWHGTMGSEIPGDAYYLAPYLLDVALTTPEVQGGLRSIPALQDWLNGVNNPGGVLDTINTRTRVIATNTTPE